MCYIRAAQWPPLRAESYSHTKLSSSNRLTNSNIHFLPMKNLLLVPILLSLSLLAVSCDKKGDAPAGDEKTIKVGHYASLTGAEATFGQEVDQGIKLAVEEINAAGGINGKTIELITEDTQSNSQAALNAAEKLLGKDKVVVLLGEVASSRSLAAADAAQRAKVPMLTPASTNKKVTEKGDYIFRICFIDPFQGAVISRFVTDSLKIQSVAMLTDQSSDYSIGLADGFRAKFGGTIVEEQSYTATDKDFKAQLTAIKAKNPQAIILPGYYTQVGLIAAQARDLGITVPLIGGDGWDSPELTTGTAKQALEGCYFTNHYAVDDTTARVKEFNNKYTARWKATPGAMSALGYDAMYIVAKIIKDSGKSDPETIKLGLAALKDYPGVTGNITINANRNAEKSVVVLKIKDGKFTYYTKFNP